MAADDGFDDAVLGFGLPAELEAALARAAQCRGHDAPGTMAALMCAQRLAPEHPAVLIALYRHYFYAHRLHEARSVARRALVAGAGALGLPVLWRDVPARALAGAADEARTRFYLFALKAYAYLCLRLDDARDARDALVLLAALDPDDCVGGSVLEAVRVRALVGDDLDDASPQRTVRGAAAWAAARLGRSHEPVRS